MRRIQVIALVLAAGCYAPMVADGVPCSPLGDCPEGQTCDATDRCRRVPLEPVDAAPIDARIDAPPDTPAPTDFFTDDFARPNGLVGNGWIEKAPLVFRIQGGEVVRVDSATNYRDNLVYRPASEERLDVALSVGVRFAALPHEFPQIFVRAVSATINRIDAYDGYLLYVDGGMPNTAVIARQIGVPFAVTLRRFTIFDALSTTGQYRMSLTAAGTSPVLLSAKIERRIGAMWISIGESAVADNDPVRITTAGTVGFSGNDIGAYIYDDVRVFAP